MVTASMTAKLRLTVGAGIALLLGLSTPTARSVAADDRVVKWAKVDLPPLMIVSGPSAGHGYAQEVAEWMKQRLPGYRHEDVAMTTARLIADAHDGLLICSAGMLKSAERAKFLTFSRPLYHTLPNRLIVTAQRAPDIRARKSAAGITLSDLVDLKPPLRFVSVRARLYGEPIDTALKQFPREEVALTEQNFVELAADRADATIAYSEQLSWARRLSGEVMPFVSFDFAGSRPLLHHIACTKGASGDAIVASVDQAARSAKPGELQRYYDSWLDPQALADLQQLSRLAPDGDPQGE